MAETKQAVLTLTVTALAQEMAMPIVDACRLVGMPRSTYYRLSRGYQHYRPVAEAIPHRERRQPAALDTHERATILSVLCEPKYEDKSVVQTYWHAFDAGTLACSQRTFYRVANAHRLVGDRRRTRTPRSPSPRTPAVATLKPGDLWSWDITELNGPSYHDRYYLYLIIDVFSRYPIGWCIETYISKKRAVTLFTDAIATHGAPTVVHSDNGSSMRSTDLINALESNGIITSYSRPRVSDDNPFSESLFKTIKYDPSSPDRFDHRDHARQWTKDFLDLYATQHRHSGLGRHTPASVFDGTAHLIHAQRQRALDAYYAQHPTRFRQPPTAPPLPQPTGINTHLLSQAG
ncbi:IS3 family transposase [Cryobacterium sp. CG_9.6]|uniref:IS3 family transposase n=1 Tax=Cryobacterium sp. CG_9.6 TaxID=2760710 RepID=UPI002473E2D6|nr:IS3 family transposase [Cryobacterium sp. CG_9.6]MDH6235324.1 transposase InsO family protein [Cryobacterium sp. CG_9.6]MDH6235675.1 transposase InsO family protein [Cryobacterium sp. CG_9.6]MDH6236169.1 transposase InsO family protein [Cryobacterium sp. CG_9.6]MDH6236865.1 transposase InsO family protein [Cryobacterium sp. CG_9.6]MDH6238068.1 transposase InsO family protein [Cryobacterium sp. CG_9.6]